MKFTRNRRVIAALVAGLVATIIGGAAAFAAADTDPSSAAPAPDPYPGSWALMIDGVYAGPVASVDDCDLQARVVSGQVGRDLFASKRAQAREAHCTFEVGLGMTTRFTAWLRAWFSGADRTARVQLVRTDGEGYALELIDTRIATVALPKIDRASTNPVFLKIALAGTSVRRASAPNVNAAPVRGFPPASLAVRIGGVTTDVATVGPWKATLPIDAMSDEGTRALDVPGDVGDLPLRVSDRGAKLTMDPWLQSWIQTLLAEAIVDDERSVVLTLTDGISGKLVLEFDHAGLATGDLVARADGNRSYTLYAERFTAIVG